MHKYLRADVLPERYGGFARGDGRPTPPGPASTLILAPRSEDVRVEYAAAAAVEARPCPGMTGLPPQKAAGRHASASCPPRAPEATVTLTSAVRKGGSVVCVCPGQRCAEG